MNSTYSIYVLIVVLNRPRTKSLVKCDFLSFLLKKMLFLFFNKTYPYLIVD